MIKLHGERLVVIRSAYSFLNTLVYFGFLRKKGANYTWRQKLRCSPKGMAHALVCFSVDNGMVEIELGELGENLQFNLIDLSNLEDCVKQFNGTLWTYIRRPLTSKIMLHQDAKQKIIEI